MMPLFNTARNSVRTYSKTRHKDIGGATRAFDKLLDDEQSSSSNVFITHGQSSIAIHQGQFESSQSKTGDKRTKSDDNLFSFGSDDDQSSKCKRSRYSTSKGGKTETIGDGKVKERVSVNKPSKKLRNNYFLASSSYMHRKSLSHDEDSEVLDKHNELFGATANITKECLISDDNKKQQPLKKYNCIGSCEKQRRKMTLGEDDNVSIVKEDNEQVHEHFGVYQMSSQQGFLSRKTHPIHMPSKSNELPYVQEKQFSSDATQTAGDLCFKSNIVKKEDEESSYSNSISSAHAHKSNVLIYDTKCISKTRDDDKPREATEERYKDVKDSDIPISSRGFNATLGNKITITRENKLHAKTFVDKLSKLLCGKKSLFHEADECVLPTANKTKSVTSVGSSMHDVTSQKSMSTKNMFVELENKDSSKVLTELQQTSSAFYVHFTTSSYSDSLAQQIHSDLPSPLVEHNYFHNIKHAELITDDHSYSLLSLTGNFTKNQVPVSADCKEKVSQKSNDSITTAVDTQPFSSCIMKDTCRSYKHSKFSLKQNNNCNVYKDSDVDESCSVLLLSPLQASPCLSASQKKSLSDNIASDSTMLHSLIDDSCYKKTAEVTKCKSKRLTDNVLFQKKHTKDIDANDSVNAEDCREKLCETLDENNESVDSRQPILLMDIVEQTMKESNSNQLHLCCDMSSSAIKNSEENYETFPQSTQDDTVNAGNADNKDCIHIRNKATNNCAIVGKVTNSSEIHSKIAKHAVEQRNSTAAWSGDFRNTVNKDKHRNREIEKSKSPKKKMRKVSSDNRTTDESSRGTETKRRHVRRRNCPIVHIRKRIRNRTIPESNEKLEKSHIAPDDIVKTSRRCVAGLSCAADVLSNRTCDKNHFINRHGSKQKAQEKMATLADDTQESNVRRLLKSPHKTSSNAKAVYNPRQWLDATKDEDLSDCAKGRLAKASSANEMCVEFSNDDVNDSSPLPVLCRVSSWPARIRGNDVVKVRVSREQKPLFAVVRNVKEAHECQEYGEKQEFQDDVDYMLDGLQSSQPLATRCLSTLSLASKCLVPAFRMHLRAHAILTKILDALHDAPDFVSLSLCLSALLFAVSHDRLAIELDDVSVRIILRLLDADSRYYGDSHQSTSSSASSLSSSSSSSAANELERIRLKVFDICKATVHSTTMSHVRLKLRDMTAGYLGMELLLSLTSKQTGDWLKETLRSHGGLKHIINAACHSIDELVKICPAANAAAAFSINHCQLYTRSEKCLKLLDNMTYMCTENQSFLLEFESSMLIETLNSFMSICMRDITATKEPVASSQKSFSAEKVNKDSPQFLVSNSLLTLLRLLLDITHESERGCIVIGQQKKLLSNVLYSVVLSTSAAAAVVCNVHQFDIIILGLSLLMNLVEKCDTNRKQFIRLMIRLPNKTNSDEEELSAIQALGMLFSESFKAARLIEETHDAEMDAAAEKRKKVSAEEESALVLGSASAEIDESGQWLESESGLQWVAKEEEEKEEEEDQQKEEEKEKEDEKEEREEEEELCRERLRTSLKQLDSQETAPSSSQDDTDNYTRDLHTAGKHMEDSFVAAYTAVLIGSIIQHDKHLIETVRKTLPELSFNPLVRMIRKFIGFMNFTNNLSSASGSKTFHDVLNVLESCQPNNNNATIDKSSSSSSASSDDD